MQIFSDDFPDLEASDVFLIGCREERGAPDKKGCSLAPDRIRRLLYGLTLPHPRARVADLGNLNSKETQTDYYFQIAHVCECLIKMNKAVILIGGTQDIVFGLHMAYESLSRKINIASIDNRFDLIGTEGTISNTSVFNTILNYKPNYVNNFSVVGYQSYLVDPLEKDLLENLHFSENMRLGEIKEQIEESEPVLRAADWVSFDFSSIRRSDAPGTNYPLPSGLSTEEACQLARYAGISPQTTGICFSEMNPLYDMHDQTTFLGALVIWYFIEGYCNRMNDFPASDRSNLTKYRVTFRGGAHEINFYKHRFSQRWWMEVCNGEPGNGNNISSVLLPCSERDYYLARNEEIPARWIHAQARLKGPTII